MSAWKPLLLLLPLRSLAFTPKDTAHCLNWNGETSETARIGIQRRGVITTPADSPILCRWRGFGKSKAAAAVAAAGPLGQRSRHHELGTLTSNGRCAAIAASGSAEVVDARIVSLSFDVEVASVNPDCEVWWREVAEDQIPPTPELTLPLWMDSGIATNKVDEKLGICRSFGDDTTRHADGGRALLGTIVLEGPDMSSCFFTRPDGTPGVLESGLFHILQARPKSAKARQCREAGELSRGLRWRVDRFLRPSDRKLLEKVVQTSGTAEPVEGKLFDRLVAEAAKLEACELQEVLSPSRFVPHELNAMGLHVLRSLLAERMADERVHLLGHNEHLDYETWRRDGVLLKDLDDPALGGDEGVLRLLRMVSGEDSIGIPEPPLVWTPRNVTVQGPTDLQTQLHIDTFAPITKVWVFQDPPGVELSQGPLLFAKGSHRNSEAKLRWMHAYAQQPAAEARSEPSFRLHGCANATKAAEDFVKAVEGRIHIEATRAAEPLMPLPGVRRTLIIADTSALHARGLGVPGHVRQSWRLTGDNDGGLKRLDPYRWPDQEHSADAHREL